MKVVHQTEGTGSIKSRKQEGSQNLEICQQIAEVGVLSHVTKRLNLTDASSSFKKTLVIFPVKPVLLQKPESHPSLLLLPYHPQQLQSFAKSYQWAS